MRNTKHTPGPWFVATSMSGKMAIAQKEDMYSIALIEKWRAEHGANAKLIAAAPELLEALQSVLPYLKAVGTNGNHLVPAIESAIKNATE